MYERRFRDFVYAVVRLWCGGALCSAAGTVVWPDSMQMIRAHRCTGAICVRCRRVRSISEAAEEGV